MIGRLDPAIGPSTAVSPKLSISEPGMSNRLPRLKLRSRPVRTPTVIQMEAVECGAAALANILSFYGRIVPLAELRQICGVSRDGSKASNILKAARHYGLEASGYRLELQDLADYAPPYIVFWQFNHFLVVEGFKNGYVYLNDPAIGRRRVSFQEFDEGFTGVTLILRPGPEFTKGGIRPNVWRGLFQRLRGSFDAVTACFIAGLLLMVPKLTVSVLAGQFIDQILVQGRQEWLRPALWILGLAALLMLVLAEAQLRFLRRLQIKLSVRLSGQFLWHLLHLPLRFYAQRFAGEISNRIRLNSTVARTLSGQLATALIGMVTMIFYGIVMLTYQVPLTLMTFGLASVNLVALQAVARRRTDANRVLQQDIGKLAGLEINGLQGIETLKASGLESDFFSRWSGQYTKMLNGNQSLEQQTRAISVLPAFVSSFSHMLILVVGGYEVVQGRLTLGGYVAFGTIARDFLNPVNTLVSLGQTIQELTGNIDRLDDVLANPVDAVVEPAAEITSNAEAVPSCLQGFVSIRNLSFSYNPLEPPLVDQFNLEIEPGQRIALVGRSGSGKSTIARLICGLYQPTSGEILFDGQLRSYIPRPVLTQSLAMVEQSIAIFPGPVRSNLTLWNPSISDSDLIKACQDAAIHDVVVALPEGYDSQLSEGGSNLSGGQRQRLEIARALVNNPSILVLDEATSALDAQTEFMIDRNLRRRGCTCIIVAHRLSTIRDCDQIIVLDHGKVVEQGTHEELLQLKGHYVRLIQANEGSMALGGV